MNVLIIGGGLAGLSAATLLTRFGVQCTTVTPEFGGLLSNVAIANPYDPKHGQFKFDYGGHVYPKGGPFHQLIRGVQGVEERTRQAFYLEMEEPGQGNWVPYPVQNFTQSSVYLSDPEPSVETVPVYSGQSLREFAVDVFGYKFYEEFFEPFNERVWTIDPALMDSDWVSTRIAMPVVQDPSQWGPNSEFIYAPGNAIVQTMIVSLAEYAKESWRWVNGRANHLFKADGKWYCVVDSGDSQLTLGQFDAVINTTGISQFVGMLERVPGVNMPMTNWNTVVYAGVMLPGEYTGKPFTWLYPDVSLRAHRVTLLSRYSDQMAPSGHDSLMFEFPTQDDFTQNLVEGFDADVKTIMELLGEEKWKTIWYASKGYPIPTLGLRADIAETKRQLMRYNLYSIGRWGSHAYMNTDHILGDALRCVNNLMSGEEEFEYLWSTDYYKVYEEGKYAS